jgi:hypothetical protein
MLIVIIIFLLTLKYNFLKPFEFFFGEAKKEFVKLFLDYLFSFLDIAILFYFIFLAQGQNWMIFFWCALFTNDGPMYMTIYFFVVNVTDLGSAQQDVT